MYLIEYPIFLIADTTKRQAKQRYIEYRLSPIFLIGIAGSFVASTQFGGEIYNHKNFSSPAFATWYLDSTYFDFHSELNSIYSLKSTLLTNFTVVKLSVAI